MEYSCIFSDFVKFDVENWSCDFHAYPDYLGSYIDNENRRLDNAQ